MIGGVIELADLPVRALMTPRSEILWLDTKVDAITKRHRCCPSVRL